MTNIKVLTMNHVHSDGYKAVVDAAVAAAINNKWDQEDPSADISRWTSLGVFTHGSSPVNGKAHSPVIKGPSNEM